MVASAQPGDSEVDIVDLGVVVDENDVVVEEEDVEDEHAELHQKGHEEPDEARRLRLLVVVIQLEQIAIQVLVGHVDHADDKKV